jgi:hypothetical protein
MSMQDMKARREQVVLVIQQALIGHFGRDNIMTDAKTYARVKFVDEPKGAPTYIRVDFRMEP